MKTTTIKELLSAIDYNYQPDLFRYIEIGDRTACRTDKATGQIVRANYERGLLLVGLANHFGLKRFLEIGTGRGYASGCVAEFCPTIEKIVTVDRKSSQETKRLLKESSVNTSKIRFIEKDSGSLLREDIGDKFDMFFVDGQHDGQSFRKDWLLCSSDAVKPHIAVFDDFGDKFPSLRQEILNLESSGCFDQMIAVQTDGFIIGEKAQKNHCMVVAAKGLRIGV